MANFWDGKLFFLYFAEIQYFEMTDTQSKILLKC